MRAPTKADGYEVCAEHLMSTPVVAVTTGHSLAAAWAAMRQRHVHHLVVFDESRLAAVARGPVPAAPSSRRHGMALVTRRVRTKDLGPRLWAPRSAAPGDRVGS